MNDKVLTVTISFEYFEKLKDCEKGIDIIKENNVWLVVVKEQASLGYKKYISVCNLAKLDCVVAKKLKDAIEEKDNLYAENMKLKYQNNSIWQLLKKKFGL
jgi:hypothetical protein